MLLCDKYRPNKLSKLEYNKELGENLKNMIQSNDFPHLLIYGEPGAGKKTLTQAILRELYGPGVEKMRIEHQIIETSSKKKLEFRTIASNHHIEINPSDLGIYDRLVVQDLIKSIAQSGGFLDRVPFKVVLISDAHNLSRDAQHSLRRTMEKYVPTIRLILCADTSSTIISPIKSRCLLCRVASPNVERITQILSNIAKKENFTQITPEKISEVAQECGRNLRRGLMMLESMKINESLTITKPPWETFIKGIAKKMLESQTIEKVKSIREDFYELEGHLIPIEIIFRVLIPELLQMCDQQMKGKVIKLASYYEHKMRIANKAIIHFEAFVVHFLNIYRKFVQDHCLLDDDELLAV